MGSHSVILHLGLMGFVHRLYSKQSTRFLNWTCFCVQVNNWGGTCSVGCADLVNEISSFSWIQVPPNSSPEDGNRPSSVHVALHSEY
jgi:hypothetical protein